MQLWTFLGMSDRKAPQAQKDGAVASDVGPLARALGDPRLDVSALHIIDDHPETSDAGNYVVWLADHLTRLGRTPPRLRIHRNWAAGASPVDLRATYSAAVAALDAEPLPLLEERVYNLTSGTSSMTMTLVLLANSERYAGRGLMVEPTRGIEWVEVPFELQHTLRQPPGALAPPMTFDPNRVLSSFIVESDLLRTELALAQRVAPLPNTLLIFGETGTGKEEVAFHVHLWRAWGAGTAAKLQVPALVAEARTAFRAINCAGLSDALLESELFGHERGAFTGASCASPGILREAGEGTVFLDEIGELSSSGQAKLLRALEARRVRPVGSPREYDFHARVIAATHRNLYELARRGAFREDLLQRLTELQPIRLPSLRERGDADKLAPRLLGRIIEESRGMLSARRLSLAALERVRDHAWPGNVRELMNVLRQAAVRTLGEEIGVAEINACVDATLDHDSTNLLGRPLPVDLNDLHLALDRHYLERALMEAGSKAQGFPLVGFRNAQTFANRYDAAVGGADT